MDTPCAATPAASALRAALPLGLALLLLAGCGLKGPLQLPGHGKDTPWPVPPGTVPPADASATKSATGAGPPGPTVPSGAAGAGGAAAGAPGAAAQGAQ